MNDPDPATPDRPPALDALLGGVRLESAVFLRAEHTRPWSARPSSVRQVHWHLVSRGRCWARLEGGEPHWADAGDLVVLPYGDAHELGGASTDLVLGYLESDDVLFDPRVAALAPLFVVSPPAGPLRDWVRASTEYALEQTVPATAEGSTGRAPRVAELVVQEALRLHLADAPPYDTAWLGALRDPVLAPALTAIHASPGAKWTVATLAREAGVSESSLDERFRAVLHVAPIRYLTGWRMHLALTLLRSTTLGCSAIARRTGYDSEEAFSRAFKRAHGTPPSAVRSGLSPA